MNKRLIIGIILTGFFFLIAVFGPVVAPYAVDYDEKVITIRTETGTNWIFPPAPPDKKHWFGTNEWGYDIFTLILYGAKFTFFTAVGVAFFRIFFGGVIGLFLGVKMKKPIGSFNLSVLNGIPAFLIVWLIMININVNSPLPSWKLAFIQGIIMTLIGIPGIVAVVQSKTFEFGKAQFVLAARSVGAGNFRVMFRHILPMLKETLVILLVNEVIVVLAIIGQLGIFNLFLGGTVFTTDPPLAHSATHEWAGLVGQAKSNLRSDTWVLLYPLAAYVFMLLGFYSLSRGLETRYQKIYNKAPYI